MELATVSIPSLQPQPFSSGLLITDVAVAGQTILPSIIKGFKEIANSSSPLKLVYQAISYKPFISLFNMTGAAHSNPELAGIGMLSSPA